MNINPLFAIDFYKTDHRRQYPDGTNLIYSNLTARSDKYLVRADNSQHKIVFFGAQYVVKYLSKLWDDYFFSKQKDKVIAQYKSIMDDALGKDAFALNHLEELHDLGYLPIQINALPEGKVVPIGIPLITLWNTHPKFFWLVNYLETSLSSLMWRPITSATIAREYASIILYYSNKTCDDPYMMFRCHDFSARGMSNLQDAAVSGAAHLIYFSGTDTISAIPFIDEYYPNRNKNNILAASVPATEHSVMSMGGDGENELETYRRLITKLYPNGILSIVSDTWDFFNVLINYSNALYKEILSRDGKVVFRPDSGDPTKIICGDPNAPEGSPEYKGSVQILGEIFGCTKNNKGYLEINPHVGLIYGDSITLERCTLILKTLESKGYASNNITFGIGSFTYAYNTRDTLGLAMKTTYGEINGSPKEVYKKPKTDDGTKFSAKGILKVTSNYDLIQDKNNTLDDQGELTPIFKDGKILKIITFDNIKANRISSTLD